MWIFASNWDPEIGAWVFGILAYFWQIAAVALVALLVNLSRTRMGAVAFLLLEIAIIVFNLWVWHDLSFVHLDAQNPIALLLFLPICGLIAVAVLFPVALLLGWRMRPDFLKEPPQPRA